MTDQLISIPAESVEDSILLIRRQKVMLDRALAKLYGVSTKVLNQAVKRNPERFPPDFMFQLTMEEAKELEQRRSRSQIVTLKKPQGKHIKYRPYAFTEHGILMLSSVLKSDRAVQVNIQIMRTFVRLREVFASNAELAERLDALEQTYSRRFRLVFEAVRELMKPPVPKPRQIGFDPKRPRKQGEMNDFFKVTDCDLKLMGPSEFSRSQIVILKLNGPSDRLTIHRYQC